MPVLVVDNGAQSLRIGLSNSEAPTVVLPNQTARIKKDVRVLTGDETVSNIHHHSQLVYTRPHERGYLVDPETQVAVWERAFSAPDLGLSKAYTDGSLLENGVVVTEPMYQPYQVFKAMDEIVYEHFEFQSCYRTSAACLSALNEFAGAPKVKRENDRANVSLVIDSGFSFTHVVPTVDCRAIDAAVTRVDVGGKLMCNYAKELVSYQQMNVLDETYVMDQCVRKTAFVCVDDQIAKRIENKTDALFYALPDYVSAFEGRVVPEPEVRDLAASGAALLRLTAAERCLPAELLFSPQNLSLKCGGVADAVQQSLDLLSAELSSLCIEDVLLTGGNACLPGFEERVRHELGHLGNVKVRTVKDPLRAAWRGGSRFAESPKFRQAAVSRQEYLEKGSDYTRSAFHYRDLL